jgi:hypothetical protein
MTTVDGLYFSQAAIYGSLPDQMQSLAHHGSQISEGEPAATPLPVFLPLEAVTQLLPALSCPRTLAAVHTLVRSTDCPVTSDFVRMLTLAACRRFNSFLNKHHRILRACHARSQCTAVDQVFDDTCIFLQKSCWNECNCFQ